LINEINNLEQQTISDIAWLAGFWDADGYWEIKDELSTLNSRGRVRD